MKRFIGAVGFLFMIQPALLANDSIETKGLIDSVTVYRGQALVTRKIEIPSSGLLEVVVQDLPEFVVPGSLFAEADPGGEVRSVRYRVRPQSEDVREEVRTLDERIRTTQDQLMGVAQRKQLNAEYKSFLASLEQFSSFSVSADLQRGLLNADTLKTLALFLLEQRNRLSEEDLALSLEHRSLNEQAEVLQRERQVLAVTTARTAREAVVFLNVTAPDGVALRVRYLVNGANWTPSYTVRATDEQEGITLEYYALIQQMSGEDWNDVSMVLSTATPSLVAMAPELTPLKVALTTSEASSQGPKERAQLEDEKKELVKARNVAGRLQQAATPAGPGLSSYKAFEELDQQINLIANEEQLDDIRSRGRVVRSKAMANSTQHDGPTVVYALTSRTVLPSRADQQQVQIASVPLAGDSYLLATPVLTTLVYKEAEVRNTTKMVLLAGPATTYVNGQFVGHGEIPTVTTGEAFTVGLGIDPTLRASRELLERNDTIQGGNRLVEFVYLISLENFGENVRTVRVMDRVPTGRESDFKLTLGSSTSELYEGATGQSSERKNGILRWDVDVPAGSVGPSAKAFDYRFKLEYDKGMSIAGLPVSTS
jgi:hypothetical protein